MGSPLEADASSSLAAFTGNSNFQGTAAFKGTNTAGGNAGQFQGNVAITGNQTVSGLVTAEGVLVHPTATGGPAWTSLLMATTALAFKRTAF
jgi:hypothetical protein